MKRNFELLLTFRFWGNGRLDFQTKPTTKTTVAIPKPGYFVHKFSIANINDVNIPAIIASPNDDAARCFSLEYRIDKQAISNATQNWISVVIHIVQSTCVLLKYLLPFRKWWFSIQADQLVHVQSIGSIDSSNEIFEISIKMSNHWNSFNGIKRTVYIRIGAAVLFRFKLPLIYSFRFLTGRRLTHRSVGDLVIHLIYLRIYQSVSQSLVCCEATHRQTFS